MGEQSRRKKMITAEIAQELDTVISKLPNFPREILHKGKLKGSQIIKSIEEGKIKGDPNNIDPEKYYDYETASFELIDHKKKVYDAYKDGGDKGVSEYLKWLDEYIKKIVAKYPNKFKIKFKENAV